MLGHDKLLPCLGIAGDTLPNQSGYSFLCGFLFRGALQHGLNWL
jgi:hypothetical protein